MLRQALGMAKTQPWTQRKDGNQQSRDATGVAKGLNTFSFWGDLLCSGFQNQFMEPRRASGSLRQRSLLGSWVPGTLVVQPLDGTLWRVFVVAPGCGGLLRVTRLAKLSSGFREVGFGMFAGLPGAAFAWVARFWVAGTCVWRTSVPGKIGAVTVFAFTLAVIAV